MRPTLSVLAQAGLVAAFAVPATAQSPREVINGYADLALAVYSDSLTTAEALDAAVDALIADPSPQTHEAAKEAWRTARVAYQQSEAFRFGNPVVDAWEGRVNAWPLDEGLIDYVETSAYGDENAENRFYTANVIANPELTMGGHTVDATTINADLLRTLHEIDGIEANVATGYHAVEFLLWGQDLNGTDAGAGRREWTDFATGELCTNGKCDRRGAYLDAASELLVSDLEEMVAAWRDGGAAHDELLAKSDAEGISAILTGIGSLSYGELAGERMKLGLILHDPEEEHDCFADNTHNSHYYDAKGIQNVYRGHYETSAGEIVDVPSVADLASATAPEVNQTITAKLDETMAAMQAIKDTADNSEMAYDQMIGYGNDHGNAMIQAAIDALVAQTRAIEDLVAALDATEITVEGSDSLDAPSAVFE